LINHDVIIKYIPGSGIRLLFAILLIVVPVFSFLRGKLNAIEIWSNEKYFTIKRLTFADESITNNFISKKLLGKLGSNLFLSDSLNTTIIILNTDRIQAIEYELHKQKSLKKHKAEATQKKGQNSPLKSTTASGLYK
jgi:DNA-binding transcriptional regulator/RsmH inhibitor MraZ